MEQTTLKDWFLAVHSKNPCLGGKISKAERVGLLIKFLEKLEDHQDEGFYLWISKTGKTYKLPLDEWAVEKTYDDTEAILQKCSELTQNKMTPA